MLNINYFIERSRRSPHPGPADPAPVGESDQAFAAYVARHLGAPARTQEDATVVFLRDVFGLETAPAPAPRRVA